jgi:hypothetical protein
MTISIDLSEPALAALRQEAADLGVSLEQLSQSILHNHARVRGTAGPIAGDPTFQEAKAATFRENEELYRRLAK